MTDYNNFQRVGAPHNAGVGANFELRIAKHLHAQGINVSRDFSLGVGVGERKKQHKFDLGSHDPAILVECKSHTWTTTDKVPSAKLSVWNEAMLYFVAAPSNFDCRLYVLRDISPKRSQSLAEYYLSKYAHLVPTSVSIYEFDEATSKCKRL